MESAEIPYSQSAEWRDFKKSILDRDGVCVFCGSSNHLKLYCRKGWVEPRLEKLTDFITLCGDCYAIAKIKVAEPETYYPPGNGGPVRMLTREEIEREYGGMV